MPIETVATAQNLAQLLGSWLPSAWHPLEIVFAVCRLGARVPNVFDATVVDGLEKAWEKERRFGVTWWLATAALEEIVRIIRHGDDRSSFVAFADRLICEIVALERHGGDLGDLVDALPLPGDVAENLFAALERWREARSRADRAAEAFEPFRQAPDDRERDRSPGAGGGDLQGFVNSALQQCDLELVTVQQCLFEAFRAEYPEAPPSACERLSAAIEADCSAWQQAAHIVRSYLATLRGHRALISFLGDLMVAMIRRRASPSPSYDPRPQPAAGYRQRPVPDTVRILDKRVPVAELPARAGSWLGAQAAKRLAEQYPLEALPVLVAYADADRYDRAPGPLENALVFLAQRHLPIAEDILAHGLELGPGRQPLLLHLHPSPGVLAAALGAAEVVGASAPSTVVPVLAALADCSDDGIAERARLAQARLRLP